MSRKILITGSEGLLGTVIRKNNSYNMDYIPTSLNPQDSNCLKLDITSSKSVKDCISEFNPDVIINCAAYTDVDTSYINKKKCHDINVVGLSNIVRHSKRDTKIVHISSDYVFDGENSPYNENSRTNPLNYYGKTKLESENLLIGSNKKFLIFRISTLYDNIGHNFFTFVFNSLNNNENISIADDQISNPTYASFFANVILDSILMDVEGLYHYGSFKSISRYEFSMLVADFFNLDKSLICSVNTNNMNQKELRPLNTSFVCDKIIKNLDIELFPVIESFKKMDLSNG